MNVGHLDGEGAVVAVFCWVKGRHARSYAWFDCVDDCYQGSMREVRERSFC